MNLINRSTDLLSGDSDLEHLHTFPKFPVFMGCVEHDANQDLLVDSIWEIGRETGIVQLKQLIPLHILYEHSHGSGDVGKVWQEHHSEFAKFIARYEPKSVLEIGGGHGRLAKIYEEHSDIPWSILEPNPTPVADSKAVWIKGFFDDDFKPQAEVSCVVHSHVLEHIYDPVSFMSRLRDVMTDGDMLIFTVPNMIAMLERHYTNCLNFEHTYFATESIIDYLLKKFGFEIKEKELFKDDHSIFYAAEKKQMAGVQVELASEYVKNKNLFLNFVNSQNDVVREYNKFLSETDGPFYLFGGHVFSQFLLNIGLDHTKIECILDNDPEKQGKRLYGTDLLVKSPKIISSVASPTVFLRAGAYNSEIKRDILDNINPNTVFV
jgi:2-polyprenyl-3-methyl-5-hydroxy-6-metoxy-1,4-benzoquinol methylase